MRASPPPCGSALREPDPPPPSRPPAPRNGRQGGRREPGEGPPAREPALQAPWPAALLAASAPAGYALQHLAGDPAAAAARFGFRPALLEHGGWTGLFTSLFVHGGWTHAGLNALAALAFGAPVSRRFGTSASGAAVFALFFVVCGVLGALGFAIAGSREAVLVGASGGISGLVGASSRMLPPSGERLAPLFSRPVLFMAGAWLVANLILAASGLDAALAGAPTAWQAHLAGYAAGLLLIGPALRLAPTAAG